ncbi:MAG: glycosyltransferase [Coprothermobacterota bacterium]|nr:glycosyltransferase [Coprothermobacterota bacterium]
MRILQVNKLYWPHIGGVEKVVQQLGEGLVKKGHSLIVLACGDERKEEEINGVKVYRTKTTFKITGIPFSLEFPFLYRKLAPTADIIIHHYPNPIGEFSELLFPSPKPKVVLYHSDVVRQKFLMPLYVFETRLFLKRAQVIVATSPNYVESSPILKEFKDKVRVIPLAVDTEFFTPEGPIHPFLEKLRSQGHRICLYVGRLAYYKGLEYLVRAAADLPDDLLVVIVGEGEEKEKLLHLREELHLERKVLFHPPVKDEELPSIYRGADVFVLPSIARSEAFGLVAIEAMACGVPVITTEIGTGTSFYNLHGQTGLVIPPKDAMELSKTIMDLFRQGREEFSSFARERIVNDFSQDVFLSRWEDVIESL